MAEERQDRGNTGDYDPDRVMENILRRLGELETEARQLRMDIDGEKKINQYRFEAILKAQGEQNEVLKKITSRTFAFVVWCAVGLLLTCSGLVVYIFLETVKR